MSNELIIDELIAEARTYLGVPWQHQGRSKKGVDCVGFILLSFKYVNVYVKEIRGYSRQPDGKKLKEIMDSQPNLLNVTGADIKKGDILLLKIIKDPQHVALVTDGNTTKLGMIHSYNGGSKKVIEHSLSDIWKKKIIAVYRLK